MTNNLPLAPEGFAWMPCADNGHAARSFDGDSWVMIAHSGMWDASRQLRLMRRLKSTEIRHDINGYAFLGSEGFELDGFDERDGRFEPDVIESNAGHTAPCGWYATVRFAPGHVPDFGDAGLRYLDEGEPVTSLDEGLAVVEINGRECVPITLPPLPILDQMCAEKPGLREGIEHEKAAHYAEEIDALRAQLAEVTAERDEAVNWMEGVLGKSLQRMADMEDWYHGQNRKIEALKAEVAEVTAQRDALGARIGEIRDAAEASAETADRHDMRDTLSDIAAGDI